MHPEGLTAFSCHGFPRYRTGKWDWDIALVGSPEPGMCLWKQKVCQEQYFGFHMFIFQLSMSQSQLLLLEFTKIEVSKCQYVLMKNAHVHRQGFGAVIFPSLFCFSIGSCRRVCIQLSSLGQDTVSGIQH